MVLGLIAARVGGADLPTLFRAQIIDPLHLHSARYDPAPNISGPHAHGYSLSTGGKLVDATRWTGGLAANGGIVSDAADEAHFLQALMRGHILRHTQLTALETPYAQGGPALGNDSYGLGVVIQPDGCATPASPTAITARATATCPPSRPRPMAAAWRSCSSTATARATRPRTKGARHCSTLCSACTAQDESTPHASERGFAPQRLRCSAGPCASARTGPCGGSRARRSSESSRRRSDRARSGLHPPDTARALAARVLLPGRRARATSRPREGSGAAGRKPLRGQRSGGHARVHARVQRVLRGGSAVLPARAQPRDGVAGVGFLRRYGTIAAAHENAARALDTGAAVLVYPGGDYETHRPSWESARVDFDHRHGFIALALERGLPVVPVVSIGGQETALFLARGERLAHALSLDRAFHLHVLPISLALPWGVNVGDLLGHVPLPAKITVQVLPRSTCASSSGRARTVMTPTNTSFG